MYCFFQTALFYGVFAHNFLVICANCFVKEVTVKVEWEWLA